MSTELIVSDTAFDNGLSGIFSSIFEWSHVSNKEAERIKGKDDNYVPPAKTISSTPTALTEKQKKPALFIAN